MNRLSVLKTTYEILDKVTPLRLDCGKLCEQACCKGGDEDNGMLLFPGEEELLANQDEWLTLTPIDHIRSNIYIARCNGTCPRSLRPLSCRIFPLTPYLTENDILIIKMDPRAKQLCPLAREMDKKDLLPEFTKAVRKASALLITESSIKAYIYDLSRMLDEYTNLPWYQVMNES